MRMLRIAAAAVAIVTVSSLTTMAQAPHDSAALAQALAGPVVKLQQGIETSATSGTPISAKFELDDKGALQLSVYTAKDSAFFEVIIDPKTGVAKSTERITDAEDLKAATAQNAVMSKAKNTLAEAATMAATENAGYAIISIMPAMKDGAAIAEVQMMKGSEMKQASIRFDAKAPI